MCRPSYTAKRGFISDKPQHPDPDFFTVFTARGNLTLATVGVGHHPTSCRHNLHLHRNVCSTSAAPFQLPMPDVRLHRNVSLLPHCGVGFRIGWSYSKHVGGCVRNKELPAAGGLEHSDEPDYEHECTDPGCSVESGEGTLTVDADARDACQKDEEIVKHFADDVDRPGLLQCANWGAKELSPQQKETFRFLQVVDAGDGTSGRMAQGVLN